MCGRLGRPRSSPLAPGALGRCRAPPPAPAIGAGPARSRARLPRPMPRPGSRRGAGGRRVQREPTRARPGGAPPRPGTPGRAMDRRSPRPTRHACRAPLAGAAAGMAAGAARRAGGSPMRRRGYKAAGLGAARRAPRCPPREPMCASGRHCSAGRGGGRGGGRAQPLFPLAARIGARASGATPGWSARSRGNVPRSRAGCGGGRCGAQWVARPTRERAS